MDIYQNLNQISNQEYEKITLLSPLENYLDLSLNRSIQSYKQKHNENSYTIIDICGNEKLSFMKHIPLVDFLKYLLGKFKNNSLDILPHEINQDETTGSRYINCIKDINNYSYVDSFYYYLTSVLKTKYNFVHGIECYDSFICQKKKCKINVADDIEYLCDSSFFNENLDKLYCFDDEGIESIFKENKKEKLNISEKCDLLNVEEIMINPVDEEVCNNVVIIEEYNKPDDDDSECEYESDENSISTNDEDDSESDENSISTNDEDDSESDTGNSISSNDEDDIESDTGNSISSNDEDDIEEELSTHTSDTTDVDCESDSDEENEDYEEELWLNINKIPTQVVTLEKCENTLDYLLEKDLLKIEELESVMFQVVTILHTYQTLFKFTHNDLHTNNIMYVHTEDEYLFYKIKNKYYKVPTFGKIYKIIDFGRSIYYCKGKLLCSDSFSSNGTAHTQYNFGPYYNENKPVLEPNYSFDLCRLACSIFDFVCDDIRNIQKYRNATPVYDLIFSWLYDDNGRNVLYKSNGEDKYPGFKLYKMISKIVHNHIPEAQYEHACLSKYTVNKEEIISNENLMDIDELKNSVRL
jgi:hypothetical protein